MDFRNDCRLCRKYLLNTSFYHIKECIDGTRVKDILTQIFPIDFSGAKFPQKICKDCFEISQNAFELQKIAIETNSFYLSSINEDPVIIKEEIDENFIEVKLETEALEIQPEAQSSSFHDILSDFKRSQYNSDSPFNPRVSAGCEVSVRYDDAYYDCNFCEKQLKPRKNLTRHMRIMHDPMILPYGCKKCIKRYESVRKLDRHERKEHGSDDDFLFQQIFECDLCGATGNSKIGMQNHLTDDHLNLPARPVKLRINSKLLKKKPEKSFKDLKYYKCEVCDEEFDEKNTWELHFMEHHEGLVKPLTPHEIEINLTCCNCEEIYEKPKDLMRHTSAHSDAFRSFRCKICDKNILNFVDFVKHSDYHMQKPTHKCLQCNRNFPFHQNFLTHVKKHKTVERIGGIKCPKCDLKLKSRKDFQSHYLIKHKNKTLFMCPICAKSMTSGSSLDQHIKWVHNKEQEKKFKCKFCPMAFVVKNKLIRHEATHSTNRPHVCEICAGTFKHIESLKTHMKRHEGLKKNHICSQCGYAFNQKNQLELHMLSHTGLKPHECKFCDRSYALKGDLVKHLRKMHVGDSIYQCEKCPKAFRLIVELREHQRDHLVE